MPEMEFDFVFRGAMPLIRGYKEAHMSKGWNLANRPRVQKPTIFVRSSKKLPRLWL